MVAGLRLAKILPWLVYLYLLLEVIVLTLAFFLLLFNASTDAEFTQWVYRDRRTGRLEPFRGIFPSATADNGSVLDFAVLFAIIVYGILAMLRPEPYPLDRPQDLRGEGEGPLAGRGHHEHPTTGLRRTVVRL